MSVYQKVLYKSSRNMSEIPDKSIALVLTSPPYPMIKMWDEMFSSQDDQISAAFNNEDYISVFQLMHKQLDFIWQELNRVLVPGGIACINIGNATRTLNGVFRLFSNHSRIIRAFEDMGFVSLPDIIWRKPTNAPNKFMGSGMYPPGAYVTFEHEYILIFRKGGKRVFSKNALPNRHESSYFWEERNIWFSDIWELKGANQNIGGSAIRNRSAAFPFELAYRLTNMFSVKGDTILDPFLGTGTTLLAALASERNGVGYEIDESFSELVSKNIKNSIKSINNYIHERISRHLEFIEQEEKKGKKLYFCPNHEFNVKTRQEKEILIKLVSEILPESNNQFRIEYTKYTPVK